MATDDKAAKCKTILNSDDYYTFNTCGLESWDDQKNADCSDAMTVNNECDTHGCNVGKTNDGHKLSCVTQFVKRPDTKLYTKPDY